MRVLAGSARSRAAVERRKFSPLPASYSVTPAARKETGMPSVAEHVRSAEPEIAAEPPQPPRDLLAEKLRAFPVARLRLRIATSRHDAEFDSRLAATGR
jgi:hypothetical protein